MNYLFERVQDWDWFVKECWGKRFIKFAPAGQLPRGKLFSDSGFEEFMRNSGNVHASLVRMFRNGSLIDKNQYTRAVEVAAGEKQDFLDSALALEEYQGGSTVLLSALELQEPEIAEMRLKLRHDIGLPVEAYLFVSPPRGIGLSPHFDYEHAFVTQMYGIKRWWLYPSIQVGAGTERFIDVADPVAVVDLLPGELLYIPSGTPHHAQALDDTSIHMDICVYTITWRDVLGRLAEKIFNHPVVTADIPMVDSSCSRNLSTKLASILSSVCDSQRGLADEASLDQILRELIG